MRFGFISCIIGGAPLGVTYGDTSRVDGIRCLVGRRCLSAWMNSFITAAIRTSVGALMLTRLAAAETVQLEAHPSNHWLRSEIRLQVPARPSTGLLVFLSPGDANSFSKAQFPLMLATNGVMTLIAGAQHDGLYTGDAILAELDSLITDVADRYGIPKGRVATGGFSAGGIGAVRYAQFCAKSER